MEKNTPYYYSECVRFMGPLMEQGFEKATAAANMISENTTNFILWVKETTPLVIEWVSLSVCHSRLISTTQALTIDPYLSCFWTHLSL